MGENGSFSLPTSLLQGNFSLTPGFHLENCPRGGGGGNWRNLDFKGCMMVKDVTKFHKRLSGGGGGGGGVRLNVCVCAGFHTSMSTSP